MSAEVPLGSRTSGRPTRLQREAAEVEAAIALVARGTQYRVLLCGLRYGGRLAASRTAQAAAAGVRLEAVRLDRGRVDIRLCRV